MLQIAVWYCDMLCLILKLFYSLWKYNIALRKGKPSCCMFCLFRLHHYQRVGNSHEIFGTESHWSWTTGHDQWSWCWSKWHYWFFWVSEFDGTKNEGELDSMSTVCFTDPLWCLLPYYLVFLLRCMKFMHKIHYRCLSNQFSVFFMVIAYPCFGWLVGGD